MNFVLDHLMAFLVAAIAVTIAAILVISKVNSSYDIAHDCRPTGESRIAYGIVSGSVVVPIREQQKRCADGEIIWR